MGPQRLMSMPNAIMENYAMTDILLDDLDGSFLTLVL
jgi:hypothetical protein